MLNLSLIIIQSLILRYIYISVFILYELPSLHSIRVADERIRPRAALQNPVNKYNSRLINLNDHLSGANGMSKSRDSPENGMRFFNDYKLARVIPHNKRAVKYLQDLFFSESPLYQLDFWQPPSRVGALVDVTVAPEDARSFFNDLDARKMEYFIVADNLQSLIVNERTSALNYDSSVAETPSGYHYDRYNPLTTIETQIFRIRDENPNLITIFDIGKTHENRSIYTVKVSSHATRKHPWHSASTAMWIDGGIHAREWIAPATAMNLLRKLVDGYNVPDPEIQQLLKLNDWYVTPVLNPDGYEYSHTKNRMWRKNRRPANCKSLSAYNSDACCAGVDINRNFDWHYANRGSSSNPCHEVYHGPGAFSEPESRAVRDFLQKVKVHSFITLHSYSQLWLIPFGHKRQTYPSDYTNHLRPLSLKATKAMSRLYGTNYAVGTGADLLYEASGTSHDYAKGVIKIPFSFLVELRPKNEMTSTGFLLPESDIMPTGEETWMAVKVIAEEVITKFGRTLTTTPEIQTTTIPPSPSTTTPTNATIIESIEISPMTVPVLVKRPASGNSRFWKRTFHTKNKTSVSDENERRSLLNTISTDSSSVKPLGSSEVELFFMVGVRAGKQIDLQTIPLASGTNQESLKNFSTQLSLAKLDRSSEAISTAATAVTAVETLTLPLNIDSLTVQKTIMCHNFSRYCKWYKIHGLCDRPQVQQKCTLNCLKECQI